MDCKIQIADSAKSELAQIIEYISIDLGNKKAANDLLLNFEEQKNRLYDFPEMYPLCSVPRLLQKGYRRFKFGKNYIALYLINSENTKTIITIMHIFYAKRDYESLI